MTDMKIYEKINEKYKYRNTLKIYDSFSSDSL